MALHVEMWVTQYKNGCPLFHLHHLCQLAIVGCGNVWVSISQQSTYMDLPYHVLSTLFPSTCFSPPLTISLLRLCHFY